MKRPIAGLAMTTVLLAGSAAAVAAQSDSGATIAPPDSQTVALTLSFDSPVLAGMTVTVDGSSTLVPDIAAAGDSLLHIQFPASAVTGGQEAIISVGVGDASVAAARVSANDATADELTAALEAAGVPAADRWVREIMEYRPYPADDLALTKLQDELTKYDPAPETLASILSVLEP